MNTGKPVVLFAITRKNIGDIDNKNLIAYNTNNGGPEGQIFIDADLRYDDLKILIDNNTGIISHISDTTLHWSVADRRNYASQMTKLDNHVGDLVIHINQDDRNRWDAKETEAGAQLKANAVLAELNIHKLDQDVHLTKIEKERFNNTYTKEEVANMVANAQANTDWKEAVNTFDELAEKYPNAERGWICTVLFQNDGVTPLNTTYCFDGENWVVAFINTMPLATSEIDGRMSKEYARKLDNIEDNANFYIHPDTINIRHVTDAQITRWDNKASKSLATIFEAGLMSALDKEKMDSVEKYANYYVLPDTLDPSIIAQNEYNRFCTDEQIKQWSNPAGILADDTRDGAMSKEMFIKLDNIEEFANYYVHPAKHSSSDIAEDKDHRFVSDGQISMWTNKEDPSVSQSRADSALQLAKDYTNEEIAKLINGVPGILDTFKEIADALGNDPNFAATMMTELSNKANLKDYKEHVSDFRTHLNATDRVKFDGIEENANYYVLPDQLPATIITQNANYRFVSDVQINTWDNKANGELATPKKDGQMSKEYAAKLESITTTGKIKSDWNEVDEDSGSFIMNKPTKLPADGGTSEFVNGYDKDELIEAKKPATIIIGSHTSSRMNEKYPDYFCDGINDTQTIKTAIESLGEVGGEIVFREGTYIISETIEITASNINIRGMGSSTIFQCGFTTNAPMFFIKGDHVTIKDALFTSLTNANTIMYQTNNNFNSLTNCSFSGGDSIKISGGNYNLISNNNLNKVRILMNTSDKDAVGNKIMNNNIIEVPGTKTAIALESTNNRKLTNSIVSGNIIMDCYSGIILSNSSNDQTLTANNCITGNSIMRGTGDVKDYLYEQHTIRVLHGSFNIVTGNMCRGRTPVDNGINNMFINNIAVDDGTE